VNRTDIEKIFAGIKPSPALEMKVMQLGDQTKAKVPRRMLIPVVISVVAALAVVTFGVYALLPKGTPASQSYSQVFTVNVCAANGTETVLTQESTLLMAYSDPGLPLTLKAMGVQATSYQVSVSEGTIWTGSMDALVARESTCVLTGEETLYWSAKRSDGSYAPSGLVSISAYSEEELLSEIIISIRELSSGGYEAKVIGGVSEVETEDGSIYLEGKVSDLVYIDAPVLGTTELGVQTADVYSATRKPVLIEPYFNYYCQGRDVETYECRENQISSIIDGIQYPFSYYSFTNGDRLAASGGYAYFLTKAAGAIHQSIMLSFNPVVEASDQVWNFATQEEAFSEVKDALLMMGIDVSDQYEVYSYDYLTLKRINLDLQADMNEDELKNEASCLRTKWSENDNCYFFILRQDVFGMPMSNHPYGLIESGMWSQSPDIRVIYTKNGIESLEIFFPYEIGKVEQAGADTISLDAALTLFAGVMPDSQQTGGVIKSITAIEYVYLPVARQDKDVNGYSMTPCWAIGVKSSSWGNEYYREWHFINAVTGEYYEPLN
jgi:hypothetical protein